MSSDTCIAGTGNAGTAPLCGVTGSYGTTGICGKCQLNSDGTGGDGVGTAQGTCQTAGQKCCASGTCKTCSDNSDTCAAGDTCKCGAATACGGSSVLDNICTGSTCKCGSDNKCTAGTTLATCLATDGTSTPTSSDTTATCKVK